MGEMPFIDLRLQRIAFRQELAVARRQVFQDRGEFGPETVRLDAGPRQRLVVDKGMKFCGDLKAACIHAIGHFFPLGNCCCDIAPSGGESSERVSAGWRSAKSPLAG